MDLHQKKTFYRHKDTLVVQQGEEWDEIEFLEGNLIELVWVEDDFEYEKGHFLAVNPDQQ